VSFLGLSNNYQIALEGTLKLNVLSNVQQAKARDARLIGLESAGRDTERAVRRVAPMPKSDDLLSLLLTFVPKQLLGYHIAAHRWLDVHQPPHLA
jgi:glucosamine--fructose-6-phosphate aminotransferase (isomerizing)